MRSTALRTWWRAPGSGPLVLDLVAALLAAAAAALGVSAQVLDRTQQTVPWPLTAAAVLLTGLALIAVAATVVSTRPSGPAWLGHAAVPRALVLVAIAAQAVRIDGGWVVRAVVVATTLALLVALVTEPTLRRTMAVSVPVASGLPGPAMPRTRRTVDARAAWWIGFVALASGWLFVLGATASGLAALVVCWVLPAAVAALVPVAVVLDGGANSARSRQVRKRVPDAVAALAPAFVVHLASPNDTAYQVAMWLPYLRRTGLPFFVLTRHPLPSRTLAALTDVPVVEARQTAEVEQLIVPSLRAACYVNSSAGNGMLVRFQQLTHVYLGHGDSDKAGSTSALHAMYDAILVPGPAAVERFRARGIAIPADRFRLVGRPQTEAITPARGPIAEQPAGPVLYAPTWRGLVPEVAVSSLPRGEQIVGALLARQRTVVFRPHPFSRDRPDDAAIVRRIERLLERDKRRTGRPHLWGAAAEHRLGIQDCLNHCAALVTDRSAVLTDHLQSGKPYAVVLAGDPEGDVVEPVATAAGRTDAPGHPMDGGDVPDGGYAPAGSHAASGGYAVAGDLSDLDTQLDLMLGADPAASRRSEVRAAVLGPDAGSAEPFVATLRTLATRRAEGLDEESAPVEGEAPEAPAASSVRQGPDQSSRQRGPNAGVAAAAGLTLFAGLLGAAWWVVLLAAVATVAGVLATTWSPRQWPKLLDRHTLARVVLVMSVPATGPLWTGSPADPRSGVSTGGSLWPTALLVTALAGVVLAVAVAGERAQAQAWRRSGPQTRNLLPEDRLVSERLPRALPPLLGSVAVPAGLVAGALQLFPLVWLAAVAVTSVLAAEGFVRAQRRVVSLLDAEGQVIDALRRLEPRFVVHFAAETGGAYQLAMWLPYLQRIDRPWMILTRDVEMTRAVARSVAAAGLQVPVVHRGGARSLSDVLVPSLTTVFYVNNGTLNTHLVDRSRLTHVWLGHGDSEKAGSRNPVHQIYDLIFTAGQAGIDRYDRHGVHIPADRFRIVGRPQVEVIEYARAPIAAITHPTVIYAPTWQGPYADMRLYSLPAGLQIVEQLLARNCRVIFRAHPLNQRFKAGSRLVKGIGALLAADRERTGREHLWGAAAERRMSLTDCFNASDAMIADISAVVSDYLYAGKPLALVAVGRTREDLVREVPAARGAYVLDHDLGNLAQVCDDLLGADPLAGIRADVARYHLGDISDEHYADTFVTTARAVVDRAGDRATARSGTDAGVS